MPQGIKKKTEEEKRDEVLAEKFGSRIQFSVKVLRPTDRYPYEHEVWVSEISVPITDNRAHIETITMAWIKTMEAGIELAAAFRDDETEVDDSRES